ncbi:hypothetical protein DCO17_01755 [Polynucleobacter tropicus]|uniref:Bacterial sugar transferase domain-containing protein n=1 Tax=Polynucleobacter tropicus TaxID=1743174 RepID=A0A6M9Q2X7_9BURK|nr:hypothetical protein DCO17_01755 [Polynucleobacter tropicus]
MLKRAFDIFTGLIALIFLMPVFALIAVAIKIESPGPILFSQLRVGRNQVPFFIHKFRSMKYSAGENGSLLTIGSDNRITGVGRVLRSSKLDELPQLFDILLGKMSFVGPRPEVPYFADFYTLQQKKIIFSVRPGLTDSASIFFINEAKILGASKNPEELYVKNILPIKASLAIDYVNGRTFIGDQIILLKTLVKIFYRG